MPKSRHAKGDGGTLTHRQREFIRHYAAGRSGREAAIAAGYSPASARAQCYDLLRHPQIKAELEKIAERVRGDAAFDAVQALREAERERAKAHEAGQYTAAVKALELKAKLAGLLVEKHELKVEQPDVTAALAAARARVVPLRYQAPTIEGEFRALPSACVDGPTDCQSDARSQAGKLFADGTHFPRPGGVPAGVGPDSRREYQSGARFKARP